MEYTNLPARFKIAESAIRLDNLTSGHPPGYAWICIGSTDPPKDPYPYVNGWIRAESEVIAAVNDRKWFALEIESLLEEKFIPNSSIDYLIEFIWDEGDSSVGIFPGYNCHLALDEDGEPVIRSSFEEDSESDPRCFIDSNSRICFVKDLGSENYQINLKENFIEIFKSDTLGKYVNEVYVIYPSIDKLNKRLTKLD